MFSYFAQDLEFINQYEKIYCFIERYQYKWKNKISMSELKSCFIGLGYADVVTHLNSGNIAFSIDENNEYIFADRIKEMIKEHFGLDISVFVILQSKLAEQLRKAPGWWGSELLIR